MRANNLSIQHWKRFGLLASVAWLVASVVLASWNETWIAVWRLYCYLAANPTCNSTVFLVAHWGAVAVVLIPPVLAWLTAWGLIAVRRRIRSHDV
jgi:hypothetical protein